MIHIKRIVFLKFCLFILLSANLVYGDETEKYLNDLKSTDIIVRVKAATELARQHNIAGARLALKDPEKKVRHAAILNLSISSPERRAGQQDPDAIAIFLESLKDKDADIRYSALNSLRGYADTILRDYDLDTDFCNNLAESLTDPVEKMRWLTVSMLVNCHVENIEKELLKIAHDKKESSRVREWAIRDLANSRIKDIDIQLIKFIEDKLEEKEIKRAAIYSLGKLKSLRAVDKIIPYVYDKDQQVHYTASVALGEIGDPKAADALSDVLVGENGKIDSFVLESLTKVSSLKALPKLLKIKPLLTDANLKMKFAEALGATDSEDAVTPLLELITDKDSAVQSWASKNLEKFDSQSTLKIIIEVSKKEPSNLYLSSLAKKAQHKLDFPEEALKEKQKQKEEIFVQGQEQEINKIYYTGFRLFKEKKYEKALPYFYEANDKFEKLYASYPDHFKSSFNQIRAIRSTLAGYYRWKVKDINKAITEYEKLISILEKHEQDKRLITPYWFALGEIYEKDIKDYSKAFTCYKTIESLMSAKTDERDSEAELLGNWYLDWISFLAEKINVLKLKQQESFSHRTLKYPNIAYGFFMSFMGPSLGFSPGNFVDEDFLNYGEEYVNIEVFDRLYTKYPESYQMLFFGTTLFRQFLKENKMDNARLISERLIKFYPDDLNTIILNFELADIYKKQNAENKYKATLEDALKRAKSFNIDIILGPDSKFSSPEKTWQLFVESLQKSDIDTAIECISPSSKHKYRMVFSTLKDRLNEIASNMNKIGKIKEDAEMAKYRIRKMENGKEITYYIYFVNILGEWKIEQF